MSETPDMALVERCQAGDEEAFCTLAVRYRDRVYNFIYHSVRNPATAEDLAQDVLVKAYMGIQRFDRRASFQTWVFRIAHNRIIDHNRRQKRRKPVQALSLDATLGEDRDGEIEVPDLRTEPVRQLEEEELEARIRLAVSALSEKLRTVVLLFDVEGLSYQEIAGTLHCPVGTVKSRLFNARSELKRKLARYLAPDDGTLGGGLT